MFTGPDIVTDGLVLALDAGNPKSYASGSTTWRDKSGNGLDVDIPSGVVFNESESGIARDGTDDFMYSQIETSTTTSFSVEVCFKANPTGGYKAILSAWNSGAGGAGGWEFQFNGTNLGVHPTYSVSYTPNTVAHVLYIQEGTVTKVYLNGQLEQTSTTGVSLIGGRVGIGNLSTSGFNSYALDSTFYTVKIYNRALSTSEILQNYNATKSRFNL